MSCYCDYEQPACISVVIRKARTEHICDECGGAISPGDEYECSSGLWEGQWSRYKTCCHCVGIRNAVQDELPCFCWYYTCLIENAVEQICDIAHELVPGRLFALARMKVLAYRRFKARLDGQNARGVKS